MKRLIDIITAIACAFLVVGGAAMFVLEAKPELKSSIISAQQEAQLIAMLRPWMIAGNDIVSQPLFAPIVSVGFFVMILTYSKRVT